MQGAAPSSGAAALFVRNQEVKLSQPSIFSWKAITRALEIVRPEHPYAGCASGERLAEADGKLATSTHDTSDRGKTANHHHPT